MPVAHRADCERSEQRRRRRRAALLGLTLGGTTLVTSGAFAGWNATSAVTTGALSAATPAVQMVDAGGGQFTAGVANLLPGDYFYRYVDIRNTGTGASPFTGTVSASGDLGSALLAQVEACTTTWTASVTTPCAGTLTVVTPEQSLSTAVQPAYGSIPAGDVKHVRYRFALSPSAPATLMGATGGISVAVSGDAVGGRDRTAG